MWQKEERVTMKEYKTGYSVQELYSDTYVIIDKGVGQGSVRMYLLVGSKKALLIDSGHGLLNLKEIIATITDKEVVCVCTHGHVDHALGARQFDTSYLHSKDFDVFKIHSSDGFIDDMAIKGLMMAPMKRTRENPNYLARVEKMKEPHYLLPQALDDIEVFDLGGRTVTWRATPGHTQGSVILVDENNHVAFDSDTAAPGAWLFLPESSPLEDYKKVLEDYLVFIQEQGITHRYAGHTGKALSARNLQQLISCVDTAMAKREKGIKVKTLFGAARIVFAGGSLLFCGR